MGASGGFPIDLILFGMIAAFLVLRLKSILGKRTGYERPPQPLQPREVPVTPSPVQSAAPVQTASAAQRVVPEPVSALGQTLAQMKTIDRNFSPGAFLDGAEKAFQMIVRAFAAGDRATLQPLLGEDTWKAFDLAITEREKAHQTHVTDIRAIHGITIDAAELKGAIAAITLRIVSDQVNMTRTESGQVISGTDAVTEITDLWTFERDLSQTNPIWQLVAARSA
ncbi:MAG: Tim44/TimA family putative adaptor protein [Acetobacteraceae bacterium]|jgi:predicted lipid-binding transport protein (Tim44 family)